MKLLHYAADLRSIAFVALALGLHAAQWQGSWRHPGWLPISAALTFMACIVNHNHQHHPTFALRWLNSLFGPAISLAIGIPACAIVAMHNGNHHVHNNQAADGVRTSLVKFRWRLLNVLLFPLVAIWHFAPAKRVAIRRWRCSRPRLYRQLWMERIVLYGVFGLLLALRPGVTLLYIGLPYALAQWCLLAINHVQHVGCDPDSPLNHSRNITGTLSNWWFLNNGFHTAHHHRPRLHWSLLPQLHRELAPGIDQALNHRTLLGTLCTLYLLPPRGAPQLPAASPEMATPPRVPV